MNSPRKLSVLFVFYTHTEQSRRVADAMAGVLRERGCDVSLAGIEFTDPRYARKFGRFPFRLSFPRRGGEVHVIMASDLANPRLVGEYPV